MGEGGVVDEAVGGQECFAGGEELRAFEVVELRGDDKAGFAEVLIAGRLGLAVPELFVLHFGGGEFGNAFEAERKMAEVGDGGVAVLEIEAFEELRGVVRFHPGEGVDDGVSRAAVAGECVRALFRGERRDRKNAAFRGRGWDTQYLIMMQLKVRRLVPEAILPAYAHGPLEDAGMDLCSVVDAVLEPGVPQAVATGLSIELPPGYEAQVRPRSGLAFKHAITVPNSPGTIDPGYRGEVKVILLNLGKAAYAISKGDRIAQMVIAKYEGVELVETDLSETARGEGGFGSSGR